MPKANPTSLPNTIEQVVPLDPYDILFLQTIVRGVRKRSLKETEKATETGEFERLSARVAYLDGLSDRLAAHPDNPNNLRGAR